jgi:hypothetical protein
LAASLLQLANPNNKQTQNVRNNIATILAGLCLLFNACCRFIKEKYLGNNFILSEYDNVDRRIIYSKERCSGNGIEVVPMTVTEYASNSKWIIAKSRKSHFSSEYQYWIVNKDFKVTLIQDSDNTINTIKSHVHGPLGSTTFIKKLQANNITLKLKKI